MRKIAPKYKDFVGEWQRLNAEEIIEAVTKTLIFP